MRTMKAGLAGVALLLFVAIGPALAVNKYWNGSTGNWSDDAAWGGSQPTLADWAQITNGTVTIDQPGEAAYYVDVGNLATSTGTLIISAGSLTVTNAVNNPVNNLGVQLGRAGRGILNMTGGTVIMSNGCPLAMGLDVGGFGSATISGGLITNVLRLKVGQTGVGLLELSGSAIINLKHDDWNQVGQAVRGTVIQTGGRIEEPFSGGVGGIFSIGAVAGSEGLYQISGGTITNFKFYVGESGYGRLEVSGTGQVYANGDGGLRIARNTGSTGVVVQTGGRMDAIGSGEIWRMADGIGAVASWTVSGGTITNLGVNNGANAAGVSLFQVVGAGAGIYLASYTNNANSTLKHVLTSEGISPINVSGAAGFGGGTQTVELNGGAALFATNAFTLMKKAAGNFGGAFATLNSSVFTVATTKPASDSFMTATLDEAQRAFSATATYNTAYTFTAANAGWFVMSTNRMPSPTFNLGLVVQTNGAAKTINELAAYITAGGITATNITSPNYPYNLMLTLPKPSSGTTAHFAWDFKGLDPNLKVSAAKTGPQPKGFVLMLR